MTVEENVLVAIATTYSMVICQMYFTEILLNCKDVEAVIKYASSVVSNVHVLIAALYGFVAMS